ncbi:MAG TPA: HAD-IA family hydrolase [Candidatus Saccharimonadales bacterium]|nr:HAD-IA family hydrolase [Candidatus Saccharimonadales bacterium]
MIQAIVFDLYGVLALNGWQAFKAKHQALNPDMWEEFRRLGDSVDEGRASYDDLIAYTAKSTGETEATVRYQLEHTTSNTELFHYIQNELKPRFRIGILSNASTNKVFDEVFTPEQHALFDMITLSHHVGMRKPDYRMYEAIADRMGVPTTACVFIDDQQRHIDGARAAGMRGVAYTGVPELRRELGRILI